MGLVETPPLISIFDLPNLLQERLSPDQRRVFERIFTLYTREIPLVYSSKEALAHVAARFRVSGDKIQVRRTMRVLDNVLGEETLFNPLRATRPIQTTSEDQMVLLRARNPSKTCDFCNPSETTSQDPFGAIENDYCFTIANAAAYDGLNSLVIPRSIHDPMELNEEVLTDMIHTGNEWLLRAHQYRPQARYPFMIFNLLPRAGASIFHPHLQVLLAEEEPYKKLEIIRQRMADYQFLNGVPYLHDLAFALRPLGLVHDINSAHIIFHLVPTKEKEVIIFGDSGEGLPNGDLAQAVYKVIKWWRNLGATSFDMAIYMPPLGENLKTSDLWHNFFPFARVVERGAEGSITSDFGAMEIYGPRVVAADPFELADLFAKYYQEV